MARVDLDQTLLLGIVLRAIERLVHARAGRRVEAPGRAVRDHERREAPLRELLEQHVRRARVLAAIRGELARVDADRAVRDAGERVGEPAEIQVVAPAERVDVARARDAIEPLEERHAAAVGQRGDRTRRQLGLGEPREDHVPVSVVRLRRRPDLRPLEADEGDQIGVARIARARVALAQALLRRLPVRGRERLGVIVEREEIELGAVAREVAGVGGRVGALARHHRQRHQEGVDRVGGVDVEIAEQHALAVRRLQAARAAIDLAARRLLRLALLRERRVGPARAADLAGRPIAAAAAGEQRESEHGWRRFVLTARSIRR